MANQNLKNIREEMKLLKEKKQLVGELTAEEKERLKVLGQQNKKLIEQEK